jgi:hypothetical protein
MLSRTVAVSLASLLLAPSAGASNDDGRTLQGVEHVRTLVDCGHPPRPDCMVDLKVSRSGTAPKLTSAGQTPPPPPKCHYESLVPQDAPATDLSVGGEPVLSDIQEQVCPAGGQVVGTPLNFVMSSPEQSQLAPKTVAEEAYSRMTVPTPLILMTPAADATQFVSLPIWLQLAAPSWITKSTTITAGGVTLTMTAVPTRAVWSMGDGSSVICRGPGSPYPALKPKDPMAESPDCGYTYTRPSASLPQHSYPVSVAVHWKVAWSTTAGQAGAEPDLTAVATTRLRVDEIQALVTDVGS